ncbi:MAG: peptidase M64, partial [Bacteroidales bacterium]|nr:peptidase M64 [Bacteroidales bacterium]
MKRLLFLILAFLPCMAFAQFDTWFENASLRVDYTLTGNDKTTQFALKELIKEPYWSGSKTNLIDNLEFG